MSPIRILDWDRFQGYTKRGPSWIKLHTSLIDQPQFLTLPQVARATLPVLWIAAARLSEDGSLPDDLRLLAVLAHCPEDELRASIQPLKAAGFIDCDETVADLATELSQTSRHDSELLSPQRERETERETERDIAPAPSAVAVAIGPSWSREACDDWIAAYHGTAPGGRIGKALLPLVKAHGWKAVRSAWRNYLTQMDVQYASPQDFAAKYGRWSGDAPHLARPKAAAVVDNNRAVLARFVAGGEK